jgi:hypothetical protein
MSSKGSSTSPGLGWHTVSSGTQVIPKTERIPEGESTFTGKRGRLGEPSLP